MLAVLAFHLKVSQFARRAALEALETFPSPFKRILTQRDRIFDVKPDETLKAYAFTERSTLHYNPSLVEKLSPEDAKAIMAQELDHLIRFTDEVPLPEIFERVITQQKLSNMLHPETVTYIIDTYPVRTDRGLEVTGLAAEQAAKKGEGLAKGHTVERGKGLLPECFREAIRSRRKQAKEVARKLRGKSSESDSAKSSPSILEEIKTVRRELEGKRGR